MGNLAHTDPFSAHFRQSIFEKGTWSRHDRVYHHGPGGTAFRGKAAGLGHSRLLQVPLIVRPQPTEVSPRTRVVRDIPLIAGLIVLLAAVFLAGTELVKIGCAYHLQGPVLDWAPLNWFNFLDYDCQKYYRTGYPRDAFLYMLTFVIAAVAEATLLFSRRLIRISQGRVRALGR